MTDKTTGHPTYAAEVYEDNGGGPTLFTLAGPYAAWAGHYFQQTRNGLTATELCALDYTAIRRGAEPDADGWEGEDDPQALHDEMGRECLAGGGGARLVAASDWSEDDGDPGMERFDLLGRMGREFARALGVGDPYEP